MSQTAVLNYNVSEKQRVKKLYIGHFYAKSAINTGTNTHASVAANAGDRYFAADAAANDQVSVFKSPTGYFPALHRLLSLLMISFGGQTRTFNM